MLSLPWLGVVFVVGVVGFRLGGFRLALLSGFLITFIAAVGLWEKAMISAYLVGVCVFLASLIGAWAERRKREPGLRSAAVA